MKEHIYEVRVRYAETDKMGVVYHANYAIYFEMGRVEWLRSLGLSYREMEDKGVMLPVVSLTIDYKQPAYYDDLLKVTTYLKEFTGVKIVFGYKIQNQMESVLTTGESTLVFVDTQTKRPTQAPGYVKEKFEILE
ncbi:MAG: acyl-CoA thioesterase [Flavobacteriales bacterium]|nr:acyl-CoA thioesterase [Flavobacteriales bacterium]